MMTLGMGALDHDFSSHDEGLKQSGKRRRPVDRVVGSRTHVLTFAEPFE